MTRNQPTFVPSLLAMALLGTPVAIASPAGAEPAQAAAPQPTLDQVLDKYVQALGGKAAIEKITSRVMTGSIEAPASGDNGSIVPGTIEIDQKAPNLRATSFSFPGNGGDQSGFNGKAGWYVDPDEGPKDMSADDVAAMRLEAEFYRPLRLKEIFPNLTLKGTAKVNGHDAYIVEAPHQDGSIERLYFDTTSGLLIRDEVPVFVPDEGNTTIVNDFSDYRSVDSVQLPFNIHQTSPDFEYIIQLREVKQNVQIDDVKFNKPAVSH